MDCHKVHDNFDINETLDVEELEKIAKKMAAFSLSAVTNGNTIVVFTMLVLQEIIEQLVVDPITNISIITQISNSIANLNNSIKVVP